jgi:hypothetical protein
LRTEEEQAAYRRWRDASVEWLKRQFGEDLQTVAEHVDEPQPHLHAVVIPPLCLRDRIDHRLHPGLAARDAALRAGSDRKEGERAYRQAMRDWQQDYYRAVSRHFGHGRVGPRRKRFRRDVALMRQSTDRVLDCAGTILARLAQRLERYPGVAESEEAAEIEAICRLLGEARLDLRGGRSDTARILETVLANLPDGGTSSSGEDSDDFPLDWGADDEPHPDQVFDDFIDEDDPDPTREDEEFGEDEDDGYDEGYDPVQAEDWPENVDPE